MKTGTRIAVVRRARGITQEELAQMCITCQSAISMIESGYRESVKGQLADIRTALRWGPEIDAALDKLEEAINEAR